MELLIGHYCPNMIEITEQFNFFKQTQGENECTTDFIAELRQQLRQQAAATKAAISELTVDIAQQKAAAEVVSREAKGMWEATPGAITTS